MAGEEPDDRVGQIIVLGVLGELVGGGAEPNQLQGEVSDDFGGGGDFDQPAQHLICGAVHLFDLFEALSQAQCDGLLAQVRQLATGDLVVIDPSGRCRQPRFEGTVDPTHRFPVGFHRRDRPKTQTGITLSAL